LPNISKWNISEKANISHIFEECISLSFTSDISRWNIPRYKSFFAFNECVSLVSLSIIKTY